MKTQATPTVKKNKTTIENKVWRQMGSIHIYGSKSVEIPFLQNHVYSLCASDSGFYLDEYKQDFELPAKIYGDDSKFAERVIKSWSAMNDNLGVLLNGVKGSGKSVTAKTICNMVNLPVILITKPFKGAPEYLASIKQDFVVFVDEYEKIYGNGDELLSLMDGAFSGIERRLFVLTTNEKRVSSYMLDRPSRLRYVRSYDQISAALIEDMVDDLLENISFKKDVIKFFAKLETLTIDIIGQIIREVNIHDELPDNFAEFFNVTVASKRYNVLFHDKTGKKHLLTSFDDRGDVYDEEDIEEASVYVNNKNIGILQKINTDNTGQKTLTVKLRDEYYWKWYKDVFNTDSKTEVKENDEIVISFEEGEYQIHSSYQGKY